MPSKEGIFTPKAQRCSIIFVVIFCKEKYDNEFDLNVGTLGIAGAHEIAWQEALAILSEDHSEPN